MLPRLIRRPGYCMLLGGVLVAGLGVALGLYLVVDAVLFRSLAVHAPHELAIAYRTDETGEPRFNWSRVLVEEQMADEPAFAGAAWYADWLQLSLTLPGSEPRVLATAVVSGGFFDLMGIAPVKGRLLREEDDVRGAAPVAVISARLWRTQFGAREDIVGSVVRLNTQPVVIVGVAPEGFSGVSVWRAPDVWMPVATGGPMGMGGFDTTILLDNRDMTWLDAVVRLAPDVTLEQAQQLFRGRRIDVSHGDRVVLQDARDVAAGRVGDGHVNRISWLLLAMVVVVAAVACADAAGLMLVRAESERAAMAIRHSLGASRGRLLRGILLESLALTALAGLIGTGVAVLVAQALLDTLSGDLPLPYETAVEMFNGRALAVYVALLVVTAVFAASGAMWRVARMPLTATLAAKSTGESGRLGLREFLVAGQVALSVALIAAAIMFTSGLRETLSIDPGFSVEDRATASINALAKKDFAISYMPILDALRSDPRVEHAALAGAVPVINFGFAMAADLEGHPAPDGEPVSVNFNAISDGYFETLGVPILEGRDFPAMTDKPPSVAIVNEAFVARYWPGRSPLGLTVRGLTAEPLEVIGVVADHKQRYLREKPLAMLYLPYAHMHVTSMSVVVAARTDELAMQAIDEHLRRMDPDIIVENMESLEARLARGIVRDRALTGLAAFAAVFATLLAAAGMYGTAAYAMRRRRREIGIRYALGATPWGVMLRFLFNGVGIIGGGVLAGSAGAWYALRQLEGVVAGTQAGVIELVSAGALIAAVALLANLAPAWHAGTVAPMEVLRDD